VKAGKVGEPAERLELDAHGAFLTCQKVLSLFPPVNTRGGAPARAKGPPARGVFS